MSTAPKEREARALSRIEQARAVDRSNAKRFLVCLVMFSSPVDTRRCASPILPHAGTSINDEKHESLIDVLWMSMAMDAEELKLATEMSSWMAMVQAQLSRRRALKRRRKVSVVHDFGACLCGCSDFGNRMLQKRMPSSVGRS